MTEPQIIMGGEGLHNGNMEGARERLERSKTYRDLSTICVVPTRGHIPIRVVESWMGLMNSMNQKFTRMFIAGMEVGAAYTQAVETIKAHEELSKWKYMLTLEEDNLPPADGLLRLYESITDEMAAVSGIYWTKGPEGQPMIYGNPAEPINFIPQRPVPNSVQFCHGIGMGFALWNLKAFDDLEPPYFETVQRFDHNGAAAATQDLDACARLGKKGWRFAVDTRVRVGHLDTDQNIVW